MPMKIASMKNEIPSSVNAEPEHGAEPRHELRPQDAELEAQDRARHDAGREQRRHHLRPAPRERQVDLVARCGGRATRRTRRARGTRSRSTRSGCAPRTRAPAAAAPRTGSAAAAPRRPQRTSMRLRSGRFHHRTGRAAAVASPGTARAGRASTGSCRAAQPPFARRRGARARTAARRRRCAWR